MAVRSRSGSHDRGQNQSGVAGHQALAQSAFEQRPQAFQQGLVVADDFLAQGFARRCVGVMREIMNDANDESAGAPALFLCTKGTKKRSQATQHTKAGRLNNRLIPENCL